MNKQFFNPELHNSTFDATRDFQVQYAGMKSNVKAELAATETCMTKCRLDFSKSQIGDSDRDCLRSCYVKYFDSCLLIENEMTNFVRGLPI